MRAKRNITMAIGVLVIVFSAAVACAEMKGTLTKFRGDKATIHSYMAPADGGLVNSQIIEMQKEVVVIDTQFVKPYAKEVADYVRQLNKPINRVIVTHMHPDHWFGLEYYPDAPTYALPEVIGQIDKTGDMFIRMRQNRELFTGKKILPRHELKVGQEIIDGVTFIFEKFDAAEAPVQVVVKLPELNTLIAQDLVYNGTHLYLGQKAFDGWIAALKALKADTAYTTILVGHGKPADPKIYDPLITYLETAKQVYASAKSGPEFKKQMVERFPERQAPSMLDISLPSLYPSPAAGAGAAEFKLASPDEVTLHNVTAQAATYQGRPAIKVELIDEIQQRILKGQGSNFPAFAILPAEFKNGIIDVDLAGELNGKGAPSARAFVGIAFHIPADISNYEAVYLRMKNGRLAKPTPPEPVISRAIQYTAHPDFHWEVSRKEFPGKYEKGANIAPAMWIHLRLEISGSELKAFINDEKEPALTVGDLKFGDAAGKIGLWVDDGTAAYFSNLRIRQK